MPQESTLSGNHGNSCNCMDPLRDIRNKQWTNRRLLARAYSEIKYRPLCVSSIPLRNMDYLRFVINYLVRKNEAIFFKKDGRILECPDVIPKCPSEVSSIQDGVNLLDFSNALIRDNITDNHFVVKDEYGSFYPISELFIAKVPSVSCSSCENLQQSQSSISPKSNSDDALQD